MNTDRPSPSPHGIIMNTVVVLNIRRCGPWSRQARHRWSWVFVIPIAGGGQGDGGAWYWLWIGSSPAHTHTHTHTHTYICLMVLMLSLEPWVLCVCVCVCVCVCDDGTSWSRHPLQNNNNNGLRNHTADPGCSLFACYPVIQAVLLSG